jgi:Ca2+-binding RTX toxin-like protein
MTLSGFFSSNSFNYGYSVKEINLADGSIIDFSKGLSFFGTEGSDNLQGTNYSDTIEGMGGNDYMDGKGGGDLLRGGDGNDTLYGDSYGNKGNDTLQGGAGADYLYAGGADDFLEGGDGNDRLSGDEYGDSGNDTLRGGLGNDSLSGGMGNDVYFFSRGEGQDSITDANSSYQSYGADKIIMEEGIAREDVQFSRSGENLVLTVKGSADQITLSSFFGYYSPTYGHPVKSVEFSDGSAIDLTKGVNLTGTAGSDTISGTNYSDTINGLGGNDFLSGGQGSDIFGFSDVKDSTELAMDTILDFYKGQDLLDVSALGFSAADFGGALYCDTAGGNTFVHDLNSDFAVRLNGVYSLTASDFKFS